MSGYPPNLQPHHRLRHYIIMITVVLIGLFVLLLFNNKSDSFGLTSAVVENVRNSSIVESLSNSRANTADSPQDVERIIPSTNDIEFLLVSSEIPKIVKETRIGSLNLIFSDPATSIKVNDDKLELGGLSQVALGIYDFQGQVGVDEIQFSLEGIAKRLEVNGISLSSANQIKISFKGLNYQKATITGVEFKDIEFVSGEGSVQVGSRLKYGLESGQAVTIYSYFGDLSINKALPAADLNSTLEDPGTQIEGFAKGLDVINGALSLNLR